MAVADLERGGIGDAGLAELARDADRPTQVIADPPRLDELAQPAELHHLEPGAMCGSEPRRGG